MKQLNTKPNKLTPLWGRISIVNAKFAADDGVHVAFDIAVDGRVVNSTLEWLDDDLDLVGDDQHLSANPGYRQAIANALGDKEHYDEVSDGRYGVLGDIADVVAEKLGDAVEALQAVQIEELSNWWSIAKPSALGNAVYGWGSEAKTRAYCALLDERENLSVNCYIWEPVSLSDAVSIVSRKEGFDLLDGLAALKEELEAA